MGEPEQINRKRAEANELRIQGCPSQAVELLQKARKKWPKHPNLLTDLASCHACVPEFEEAEECLLKLPEWFPGNEELLFFGSPLAAHDGSVS
jgi:thioredoxin-like negative regulator of GroEL